MTKPAATRSAVPTPAAFHLLRRLPGPGAAAWGLLLMLACGPALAAAIIGVDMDGPAQYIPGTQVDNGWTLAVDNTGDAAATPEITTDFPAGVSVSWTCAAAGTGSSCASASGTGNLNRTADVVGATNGSLTYVFDATLDSSLSAATLTVTGSADPGTAITDAADTTLSPLTFTFTGPASYTPGRASNPDWVLVVSNSSASTISNFDADVSFSGNPSIAWTCTAVGTGSNCAGTDPVDGTGDLDRSQDDVGPNGGTITYTLEATYASSTTTSPISVTGSAHDGNQGAPTMVVQSTIERLVNVTIDKSDNGTGTYTPGTNSTWRVAVGNTGPSDVSGVLVTDTPPAGMTVTGWTCTTTGGATCAGGTGSLTDQSISLPADSEAVFIVTGSHPSSATAASITNTAAFTLPSGVTNESSGGSSDTATKGRLAVTDLSVAGPADGSYTPGTTGNTIVFTVSNGGPSDSIAAGGGGLPASVAIALPKIDVNLDPDVTDLQPVAPASWACNVPARCGTPPALPEEDDFTVPVTLADGQSVTITLTVDYPSRLTAPTLVYQATATTTDSDPASGNDADTVSYDVDRRADLEVTKTVSQPVVNPGTAFSYDVTVSNHGPSDTDLLLTDNLADVLERSPTCDEIEAPGEGTNQPCWEYCPEPGTLPEACLGAGGEPLAMVRGSGDLLPLAIPAATGESYIVRVYAAVGDTADGTVGNTASVARPGDVAQPDGPDTTANSASVEVEVEVSTDIAVAKTDDATSAVPGEEHSYTVTVSNDGFVAVDGVLVNDALPLGLAGFVPASLQWQCQAFDGACCNTNSSVCGALSPTPPVTAVALVDHGVDLPAQSHVVFTFTGTLDARASGTLTNTVSAALPAGITDTDEGNNEATDTTALDGLAGLSIVKRLDDVVDIGNETFRLTYFIDVGNAGPSSAIGVAVDDVLDDGTLDIASASWQCEVTVNHGGTQCADDGDTGNIDTTVDLDVDGAVRFTLVVDTDPGTDGLVSNTASAVHGTDTVSDTDESSLIGEAELSISKSDGVDVATPGEEVEYLIRVRNLGPDDVFGARVTDQFVRELEDVSWSCSATTPIPGDLSFVDDVSAIPVVAGNALAVTADGRHAYQVATADDALVVYARNNVPGFGFGSVLALETEFDGLNDASDAGPAVAGMTAPVDVAVTTGGSRVYVLSPGAIAVFFRDADPGSPNFGRVTFAGSLASDVPADAREMALTADFLFVASADGVSTYALDDVSGLPSLAGVHEEEGGWDPLQLAVMPQHGFLFVASSGSPFLRRYAVDEDGALALEDSIDRAEYAGATELVAGPEGKHVYLSSQAQGTLNLARLAPETLAMAHGTSYDDSLFDDLASPPTPEPLRGAHSFAIAPDGEHLLLTANGNLLLQLQRDPGNGLLLEAQAMVVRGIDGAQPAGTPDELVVTSDGRHLLVASASSDGEPLQVYARRAPDPLFALVEVDRNGDAIGSGSIEGLLAPTDVAVANDGAHVYVVSQADDSLIVFRRSPTQGMTGDTAGQHLEFVARYQQGVGGVQGLDGAHRVRVSPDNSRVYVTSEIGNSIAVFTRDAVNGTGALTFKQVLVDGIGAPALSGATGIAIDGSHSRVYVAAPFDDAIAVFQVVESGLAFLGEARNGVAGVTGMDGVTDLAVSGDGLQLLAVSNLSNSVNVFNRSQASGATFGTLAFVQSRLAGAQHPVAISLPRDAADPHAYIAAANSDEVVAMRRITDPSSPEFGRVVPLFEYGNNIGGISGMDEPYDLAVSPDGRRVYVAARNSHSVLVFDRDLNRGSANYGGLVLAEVRTDNVDGVDGIERTYALAVSSDARHVYVAGFDDSALASFAIGSGSTCSAGGSGELDDLVSMGSGGTLEYRVRARIRPDATGTVCNTATVEVPQRFVDPGVEPNSAQDCDDLVAEADLSISKTNDQVSVVAGQPVSYEVVVRNPGPSHLVHTAGTPVTLTDALPATAGFDPNSATWTCTASGSGALDFVAASSDGMPGAEALGGVTGLALLADSDAGGALGSYLAAASVLDNAVTLFRRDPLDGRLLVEASLVQGVGATSLMGARALAASADGRFLYVASRVSDSVTVLRVDPGTDPARAVLTPVQVVQGLPGLDQAVHLVLAGNDAYLYVAAANASAVTVFARDDGNGLLTLVETETQGLDDLSDAGATVTGLSNVQFLAASPDGAHLYALSGAAGSVARFDRDAASGRLSFAGALGDALLPAGASLAGASSAVFEAAGDYLYVAAADSNAVLVLQRSAATGALAFVSQVEQGVDGSLGLLGPRRLLLSGDGGHLYVSAQAGDSVAWYLRDPLDGSLRYLGQRSSQSAGVSGLAGATGMVLDEALGQLYVAGTLANAVVQLERQSDSFCPPSGNDALMNVPFDIAAGGSVVFNITVQVASTLAGPLVNEASVDAGAADTNPDNDVAVDIDVYTALADLTITKDDGLAEFDGLAGATAIDGDADHLYVAGAADNAIGVFARVADAGAPGGEVLRFLAVARGGVDGAQGLAAAADLLLSVDGAHVYVASPVDNSVATYARADDGTLAFAGIAQNGVLGVTGLSGANALAQSPDGRHVYVAGGFSNAIAVFDRDADPGSPDYGKLSFRQMLQNGVGGVQGLGEPVALAISPDGLHVYALGAEADTIAVFRRNPNPASGGFGDLAWSAQLGADAAVSGLLGVRSLLVHPAGGHVYVLGSELGSLVHFSRDAGNGNLAYVTDLRDGEGGVAGLAGGVRLRASPGGDTLYVAAAADAAVLHFSVDGAGTPAFAGRIAAGDDAPATGGNVLGLDGVSDVFVDALGAHAFTVSSTDAALAAFGRAADGALAFHAALFDGLGGVAPGDPVRYVIRVDNEGPSDVAQARVVDRFPDAFATVSWECREFGGAQCVSTGNSNIDSIVELPTGSHVVFEATGIVGESATGRLVNTATVAAVPTAGVAAVDPDQSSNSATDGDTVLSPASNLVVSVDDGATTAVPGAAVAYDVVVANLGPSYAVGVELDDAVPAALRDVSFTCAATPVAGVLSLASSVAPPLDDYRALRISALGQHAYAVGASGGIAAVALYRRDPLSGALSVEDTYEDGIDALGIAGASDLVLSGDERFVWVAGAEADAIALFARDAESGALDFVQHYQDGDLGIDGLGGVAALALAPGGAVLYAASPLDEAIMAFAVDPASGALSPIGLVSQAQPGVEGLAGVDALAFSADGAHLFAIAGENQALTAFARAANGTLTQVAVVQDFELDLRALQHPAALLVAGSRILVADAGGDRVSQFGFVPEQGFSLAWSLADGEGITGLSAPGALAFDPEQARLYVAAADSLHLLSLLGDTPAPLASYTTADEAALQGIAGLTLAPDGELLYSVAGGPAGVIGAFDRERGSRCEAAGLRGLQGQVVDIAAGGQVAFRVQGLLFANAAGTLEYSVSAATRSAGEELDPSDNSSQDLDTLTPAPDLAALKSDGLAEVVAGTAVSWRIDLANAGVSDALDALLSDPAPLFPADPGGLLAGSGSWTCDANLPLAAGAVTGNPALAGVAALAVAPDGSRLYAVNPATDALLSFPRQPNGTLGAPTVVTGGSLPGGQSVTGLDGASSVAVTPDGAQVLVTGADANSLVVYAVGAGGALDATQQLSSGVAPVVGLLGAAHVVVSDDGRRVFVAAPGSDAIAVFSRDTATGVLAFVERVRDGNGTVLPDSNVLKGVRKLRLSGDGSHLYALATTSQAVTSFAVHPQTGRLTYLGRTRSDDPQGGALAGARDFAGSGDSVYALGSTAITLFRPGADGVLAVYAVYDGIPGLADPHALALDAPGSRLYLADSAGAVHVFARDWSDGSLELRQRYIDPLLPVVANGLLSTAGADLYLVQPAPGRLERLDEQALSRCQQGTGTGDAPAVTLDLGVGGWAAVEFSALVDPSARGTLSNTATFAPTDGADPSPTDNVAGDSTGIRVVSDLSLSKIGPATAVAGEQVEYRIAVSNAGPSSALGMRVLDLLPASLQQAAWTCSASAGSSCDAAGTGSADVGADLLPGGSLEVVLVARVAPGFRGALPNASSLVMEPGATDPTVDDHASDVSTTVSGEVTLSLAKDNGSDGVVAGLPTTYTITVANAGPSDALSVAVADLLPAPLGNASWTCIATGAGSACPASGQGDLQVTGAVGAQGSIAFTLAAMLDAAAEGVLENSATVTLLDDAIERSPGDEQDTDSDAIRLETGLSVALATPVNPFDPASAAALPFTATVANAGPSLARQAQLTLTFSAPVAATVPPGCSLQGPSVVNCSIASIEPGSATTLAFALRNLPAAPGTFNVLANVVARDTDPSAGNDLDSRDITLQTGGDVLVTIDNDQEQLVPGRAATYIVEVANIGSTSIAGIAVDVTPAAELLGASWTCTGGNGATCTASGSGAIVDTLSLASGQSVRYTLDVVVDPALDPDIPRMVAQAASATTPPGSDMNIANNTAVDEDVVFYVIFADGFEDPLLPTTAGSDRLGARECAWLGIPPEHCPANAGAGTQ